MNLLGNAAKRVDSEDTFRMISNHFASFRNALSGLPNTVYRWQVTQLKNGQFKMRSTRMFHRLGRSNSSDSAPTGFAAIQVTKLEIATGRYLGRLSHESQAVVTLRRRSCKNVTDCWKQSGWFKVADVGLVESTRMASDERSITHAAHLVSPKFRSNPGVLRVFKTSNARPSTE